MVNLTVTEAHFTQQDSFFKILFTDACIVDSDIYNPKITLEVES